ncbi:MAG: hypothetical protein JXR51_11340 [Bacteroidales bacterium]|nr:hypothetical protein [Bacteroidales bacterium]MBN2757763.1 hypothetical protein [Bacteroidales bacterium]
MRKLLTIFFLGVILFSCNENKEKVIENNNQDVFDEKLINTSYKSRYNKNAVDKLFDSYLETNKDLKAELNNYYDLNKKIRDDKKPFKEFILNNDNYYQSAIDMANTISDSILSKQIIKTLNISKKKYLNKSKEINDLDSFITYKIKLNNNLISALKIVHSLQIIEKYQQNSDINLNILVEDDNKLNSFKESFDKKVKKEIADNNK